MNQDTDGASTAAFDVIIVGGGIMGTSAAFFLSQRGHSVLLLERGLIGQQASGVNFGNVRRQGRGYVQLPLANRSAEIWRKLPELIGEGCEFMPSGHLRVSYNDSSAAGLVEYAEGAREHGLDLEILSAEQIRKRFSYVGPEANLGTYSPHDGHANPRITAPAFARAARRQGAHIRENTEVLSIEKVGDDFHVETKDKGTCRAPTLLVTAGAWGGKLAERLGEKVPLLIRGPQMGVTEPVPYSIAPVLSVKTDVPNEIVYLRQVERGNIVFGGGYRNEVDAERVRAYPFPDYTVHQMPQLIRLLPGLEKLHLIRVWSGIESYLPDDLPIMCESSKMSGLFYAFAFCGAGFQTGPAVGDVMAELISTGSTTTPIDAFHIDRFAATAQS